MILAGYLAPIGVYVVTFVLQLAIPTRPAPGYVTDPKTGAPYRYRLNGLWVFLVTIALWALACGWKLIPWDFFWITRWEGMSGACVAGLIFTLGVVFTAPATGKGLLADLYLGRLENPQWLGARIDAKMWLYLVGATLLGLNILGAAAHHLLAHPADPSPGVALYAGLFILFLLDYLTFERVHLYTYDFVAERVGFKLGWGCFFFYPYFYCIGLWATAALPNPHTPAALLVSAGVICIFGWCLARGANMQKYVFKRDPNARFLGLFAPQAIAEGDKRLLVSGFWGAARHINYLGEILMGVGLTLALGYPTHLIPWLYPLYYVALLVPRQIDDDKRCAAKYGALWDEYVRRVRWRIIPGLY